MVGFLYGSRDRGTIYGQSKNLNGEDTIDESRMKDEDCVALASHERVCKAQRRKSSSWMLHLRTGRKASEDSERSPKLVAVWIRRHTAVWDWSILHSRDL